MTTQPTKASSQKGDTSRTDKRRVRMAWFEHGNSRIYYEAQGSGDPVLVLPGLFGCIEEFSSLRDTLVAEGYQVIAADLPGSGRSEPLPRTYSTFNYEEDAHAFAALLQHLESEPAHLVGFGSGGEISLLMAAIEPEVVRSVVTCGAIGTINDSSGELREAIYNVVDNPIPSLQNLRNSLVATFGEERARAMTQSVAVAMSDIIKGGGDLSLSKVDLINCPVLLIAGEHDIFASPTLVCKLAAHMPTAEMLVAQGAEHFMFVDRPEWLTNTILKWMRKL